MQLALRPYVTTGVAIVGASVIAVAPIAPTPPDIQVPNPTVQVGRAVQLAATFEETVNSLIFRATELGLAITVPPTAALLNAVGLVPAEPATATAQAAATVLLLGLAGPLISGPGSIGTAIQNIIDANGLSNILLAIFPGALITIIDGFVNGGYGPDLAPLALDSLAALDAQLAAGLGVLKLLGAPLPTVLAGGLINPGGAVLEPFTVPFPPFTLDLPVGITLPGTLPTIESALQGFFALFGSSSNLLNVGGLLGTLGGLLGGGLPGLPGLTSLQTSDTSSITSTSSTLKTNDQQLVTLDVAPNSGEQTHGKPDTTSAAPKADLTADLPDAAKVPPKVDAIKSAIDTAKGPDVGKKVADAAKPASVPGGPTTTTTTTDTPDMTDGGKVVPETVVSDDGKKGGGSNPGAAISSVAKSLAGAVKGALGG